jgi:integrase
MGRKSTVNLNLPPHLRARQKAGGIYYYYDTGSKPRKEIPLGKCYIDAIRKWADLDGRNNQPLVYFKDVAERYLREIIPTKSSRTQDDNLIELKNLLAFFNNPPAPISEIKPMHVRQFLDNRTDFGKHSTTRANREKALLSHIFNMARSWGALNTINPCTGIKGYPEKGRKIYIEDPIYAAVYSVATQPLKDALDLAYLTGQRPADLIKMSATEILDSVLKVEQGKTKTKLLISVMGELKILIERILVAKQSHKIQSSQLICTETGRPISQGALRQRFTNARAKAAKQFEHLKDEILKYQYRDLRAKAATDKAAIDGMREAQLLAGHKKMAMTENYVRDRIGQKVTPTK